jgi:hypothetical protein
MYTTQQNVSAVNVDVTAVTFVQVYYLIDSTKPNTTLITDKIKGRTFTQSLKFNALKSENVSAASPGSNPTTKIAIRNEIWYKNTFIYLSFRSLNC